MPALLAPEAAWPAFLLVLSFLPQVPAPHFVSAGAAAQADEAMTAAASVAMDFKVMVVSSGLDVHTACTVTMSPPVLVPDKRLKNSCFILCQT